MATRLDSEMSKKLEVNKRANNCRANVTYSVQGFQTEDSPFHLSRAASSTDATVYPPPTISEELTSKKRKLNGGSVSAQSNDTHSAMYPNLMLSNQHIVKVHADIKKECEQLADLVSLGQSETLGEPHDAKVYRFKKVLKLTIRIIACVDISPEALNELVRSQESAYNLRDGARADHLTRAKICSKLIKYPHIEDYALSLKEHDEKQLYLAKQHLVDIRNIYAVITDILHKNINKVILLSSLKTCG
ncbi:hypothetical protein HWV62_42470 [Athelia sp. TMB]|nr:hypothetical protein HWV62_42470 [Athelia sp. TMB]